MRKHLENPGFTAPARHRLGKSGAPSPSPNWPPPSRSRFPPSSPPPWSRSASRANVVDGVIGNEGSLFGIALLLGLIFIGMGGLSLTLPGHKPKKH